MSTDMSGTIIAKSDQLNSDDLISGSRTITISGVSISPGEQPVTISYQGDNGKPWKPCKSMCRVLVAVWGADAKAYIGKSLTLYRDPTVKWGGMEVGGIRISHMSDMDKSVILALTATRGSKKATTIQPLKAAPPPGRPDTSDRDNAEAKLNGLIAALEKCASETEYNALVDNAGTKKVLAWFAKYEDISAIAKDNMDAAYKRLTTLTDEPPL